MRFAFLSSASLLLGLLGASALACSAKVEPTDTPAPSASAPPGPAAPRCAPDDPSLCAAAVYATPDEPPHDGAVLWAQIASGTAGKSIDVPKLAVYPDGTLLRTPVVRNLAFYVTPPRGLLRVRIAPASLARLRADVDAAADAANLHAFAAPSSSALAGPDVNVLELGTGSSCFRKLGDPSTSCVPDAVKRVHADLATLLEASEQLWRDARSGTVSLETAITVRGPWPLAQDVTDGTLQLTREEWSRVGEVGLYRLDGGDFLDVNFATDDDGGKLLYVTRMSAITLGDDQADITGELLANVGRYTASKGTWLGVPLGVDRFPAFKNREIAIVPASDAGPERLYSLKAIETFDLEGEAPIALP